MNSDKSPLRVISGMPGVGKTELAIKYASTQASKFDILWFISSTRTESIERDLGILARSLLPEARSADAVGALIADMLPILSTRRYLLIFDDVSSIDQIRFCLPSGTAGQIVITSRSHAWRRHAEVLELHELSIDDSLAFFRNAVTEGEREAAATLARRLGYLPIALEHARAYMEETGTSLPDYVLLSKPLQSSMREGLTSFELNLQSIMDRIKAEHPSAANLLNMLAFMAPREIPILIFDGDSDSEHVELRRDIAILLNYSLVSSRSNTTVIHQLIQEFIRGKLSSGVRAKISAEVIGFCLKAWPKETRVATLWLEAETLLPHVLNAAEHLAQDSINQSIETTPRLHIVTDMLLAQRRFGEALACATLDERLNAAGATGDPFYLATLMADRGDALRGIGNYEAAKADHWTAHGIRKKFAGSRSLACANTYELLGHDFHASGQFNAAVLLQQCSVRIYRDSLGSTSVSTAAALNGLGHALRGAQRYEESIEIYRETLKIRRMFQAPPIDVSVASTLIGLGLAYGGTGGHEAAAQCHEEALGILHRQVSANNPRRAEALEGKGLARLFTGRRRAALKCWREARRIYVYNYGVRHDRTERVVRYIALVQKRPNGWHEIVNRYHQL